ncbi:hypothetical protein ACIG47_19175 [Promicromonospora sp. NPDC052451]|uniref:ApeA N-terminal domain 1-containing protein n=1 Tax=Promicromonospora sp. NPDC052451 TaxID=3364407 RepID=UPI0037CAA93F
MGRFWLAGAEPDAGGSDGICRVKDGDIHIEVVAPLTEWMVPVAGTPSVLVPRTEETDLVVHGSLPVQPGPVTLLGARTVKRSGLLTPLGGDAAELHRLRADWCITGVHIDGPETRFTGVRARFTHLELWARTGALQIAHRTAPPRQTTATLEPGDAVETPFGAFGEDASLRVSSVGVMGSPGPWGVQISTYNWLQLDQISGWTLDEALTRFIGPVQVLLTLLAGEECSVTHLELEIDGRWCAVYGHKVRPAATRPDSENLLLDSDAMPLDKVAAWCEMANRLRPTPQVISSAVSGDFATLEAEALALTTTAEGMDRVLYPNARRFDEDQVSKSIQALKNSDVPIEVSDALTDALKIYFYEDSYPTRMRRLADSLVEVAPRCVGRPNKWKQEIASLRIGLAHALDGKSGSTDDAIRKMHAQVLSLRWAILLRLLLEAGVQAETLAAAVDSSTRFRRDERAWHARLPKVFPDAGAESNEATSPSNS